MAKYLVLHTYDPRRFSTDAAMKDVRPMIDAFTRDTYCVTSWTALGAGKTACLWEAPSEQALIDVFARAPDLPIDGIYPAGVVDWAEMRQIVQAGQPAAV